MAKKAAVKKKAAPKPAPAGGGAEQVGFHKGALTTLAKEREELMRILQIVEQLMQMHVKSLQEMGIDLAKQGTAPAKPAASSTKAGKPIEDILR